MANISKRPDSDRVGCAWTVCLASTESPKTPPQDGPNSRDNSACDRIWSARWIIVSSGEADDNPSSAPDSVAGGIVARIGPVLRRCLWGFRARQANGPRAANAVAVRAL